VKLAIGAQRASRIAAMIELAKSEPGIPITPDQLDSDPWLFNVLNRTLDLHDATLRPHRPDDLITKLVPVEYRPDAPCGAWLAFLDRIMAGNRTWSATCRRLSAMR
jgi:putative DNA primase/helicase